MSRHPKSHPVVPELTRIARMLLKEPVQYERSERDPNDTLAVQRVAKAIDEVARREIPSGRFRIAFKRNAAGCLCICIIVERDEPGFSYRGV